MMQGRRLHRRKGRRRAGRRPASRRPGQAPERQRDQRQRLQQGQQIEQPDRAAHADHVDRGDRADQQRRSSRRARPAPPNGGQSDAGIGREDVGVGGERGDPRDIIEPAGLEGDERAERRGIGGRPARYADAAPASRANGKAISRNSSPKIGNSQGLSVPNWVWSVPGRAKMPAPTMPLNDRKAEPVKPMSRRRCVSLPPGIAGRLLRVGPRRRRRLAGAFLVHDRLVDPAQPLLPRLLDQAFQLTSSAPRRSARACGRSG